MHNNLSEEKDKSFEVELGLLLAYALDFERRRLEKSGRLRKYGSITVCEKCLQAYIVDYVALSLERNESKKCELCGEPASLLFHAVLVDSLKPRLEEIRRLNQGR